MTKKAKEKPKRITRAEYKRAQKEGRITQY
jgi:hypothetical protein